ncbi:MAG: hypothetical protein NDJ89_14520 [Oligoflexia bacterium]|nr:hypothetical protein [Oligoflexia bacterium]
MRPFLPWIVAFLFLCAFFPQEGGVNPLSRFAAMRALATEQVLHIDPYVSWTPDWAKAPDGHFYSNKAPGPMLLGAPLAWVFDRGRAAEELPAPGYRGAVSFFLQAVPFAIAVALALGWLGARGVSFAGRNFAALAMLFGNTSALYMSSYFGHGSAAAFLLGAVVAVVGRRLALAGLLFGVSVLCDYGVALVGPPLLGACWLMAEDPRDARRQALRFLAGGVLPGVVFGAYHWACFGGPFTLPMKFQNPEFVEPVARSGQIWGIIGLLPDFKTLGELLVGSKRGILFTQPWVLVLLPALILEWGKGGWKEGGREDRALALIAGTGLSALLWMNSGFNGWHGGSSVGPRYLSMIFPVFGLVAGLVFDRFGCKGKALLWTGLGVSLVFYALVFATRDLLPGALWPHFLRLAIETFAAGTGRNLLVLALVFGWAARKVSMAILELTPK